MKQAQLMAIGLLFSAGAQASPEVAISAFLQSAEANQVVRETAVRLHQMYGDALRIEREKPTAALISSSCGFAGCGAIYLVTQGLTPRTFNPQTAVVGAEVEVFDSEGIVQKVLSPERMAELRKAIYYQTR
jgi:hypothetical protein